MFGYICLTNICLSEAYLWICLEMFIVARAMLMETANPAHVSYSNHSLAPIVSGVLLLLRLILANNLYRTWNREIWEHPSSSSGSTSTSGWPLPLCIYWQKMERKENWQMYLPKKFSWHYKIFIRHNSTIIITLSSNSNPPSTGGKLFIDYSISSQIYLHSSAAIISLILYFCTLPLTVRGYSVTNLM